MPTATPLKKQKQQQEYQDLSQKSTTTTSSTSEELHPEKGVKILIINNSSDLTGYSTGGEDTTTSTTRRGGININRNRNTMALPSSTTTSDDNHNNNTRPPEDEPTSWARSTSEESTVANNKRRGLFSFFSRKKTKEEVHEGVDDVNGEIPNRDQKYNVDALRVPSILDKEEGGCGGGGGDDDDDDVNDLLKNPYAELGENGAVGLMNEYDEDEDDARRRFIMALTSKLLFLIGSTLFLVLAAQDFQRVVAAGPRSSIEEALGQTGQTNTMDDGGDPFVISQGENATTSVELASLESTKNERAGSFLSGGTRARARLLQEQGQTQRNLQVNWYTQYWANLPPEIQDAASLLGYDQDIWDNAESVYADRLYWHQLTPDQQEAAWLVFGYTETSWNAYVDRFLASLQYTPAPTFALAPTSAPTFVLEETFAPTYNPDSTSTPSNTPQVAESLPTTVADFPIVAVTEEPTAIPGEEQPLQEEGTMDDGDEDEEKQDDFFPGTPEGDPKANFYRDLAWSQLPPEVREAAETLGYTRESWDSDGWVLTSDLFWNQLTEAEKEAAMVLGYTEETFNNRNGGVSGTGADSGNNAGGGSGNSTATNTGDDEGVEGAPALENGLTGNAISGFNSGYSINIEGEYPPEPRGRNYMIFCICAAACFVLVGLIDGFHQQLGFHAIMVLAGIAGVITGAFTTYHNSLAFNLSYSISAHLFLLQAALLIYSRLLLTYDNVVRKVLALADGLFASGALINVVISYVRYDETTKAMAITALAAASCWCLAGMIYVETTILLWHRQYKARQANNEELSIPESCNVTPNDDGACEIAFTSPPEGTGPPQQRTRPSNKGGSDDFINESRRCL